MEISYVLFLDDARHPEETVPLAMLERYYSDGHLLLWAKDVDMAKFYIEQYGMPVFIHFDHDLGDYPGYDVTAMDLLNWLRETEVCELYAPPGFLIHSANPVGQQNILSFMSSWSKVWETLPCDLCQSNKCRCDYKDLDPDPDFPYR